MKDFASYEKIIESTVVTIKHILRIRLNTRAIDVIELLRIVPPEATVSMIVGDDTNEGSGELVFVQEQLKD